jgi:hypothetical protein
MALCIEDAAAISFRRGLGPFMKQKPGLEIDVMSANGTKRRTTFLQSTLLSTLGIYLPILEKLIFQEEADDQLVI